MVSTRELGEPVPDFRAPPPPTDAVLTGRLVRLEPLNADRHAADLFSVNAADDRIWDYMPYGPFGSLDDYAAWVRGMQGKADPWFVAIIDRTTERAMGVASYLRIAPEIGTIEVGHICYSPALQGTVAATEAMYLMMKWAFEAGYRRYEWKCNALNIPSRRAAERLGLSYEGIFRQATIIKGRNRDTAWFAAIDKEWPELQLAFETWLDPANFDAAGRQKRRLSDLTSGILVLRDPVFG